MTVTVYRRTPKLSLPSRQRGAILLVMALILIIGGAWFGLRILSSAKQQLNVVAPGLVEARDALLGATAAMTISNVVRPGQLPTPDFLDPGEGPANYDGGPNNCALSTWVSGAALSSMGTNLDVNLRCFGRIPWAALGLGIYGSFAQADPTGSVPWYAMSANLAPGGCVSRLNPTLLVTTYTPGTCNTPPTVTQPFPWLTVRDYKGNVLTTRAAFVLLLPGAPVGGQSRPAGTLAGPAAYLDSVTVTAACAQPCVPGTYNNARFNWPDSVGLSFIQCAPPNTVGTTDPSFAQPYLCNDRLLYVTIDELMEVAERRAMSFAAEQLQKYFLANQFFPYAAPISSLDPGGFGQCKNLLLNGLIPHVAESNPSDTHKCPNPAFAAGSWFDANRWGEFIYYIVAADCAQTPTGPPSTNCAGTTGVRLATGAVSNARAIVIGAGAAIVTPPFAVSKSGAAQARPSPTNSAADYLDSVTNLNGVTPLSTTYNRFDAPTNPLSRVYNDKTLVVAP